MSHHKKLSPEFSGAIRAFSFWVASGSVGSSLLHDIDYRQAMIEEPSMLEIAYVIFANVLEFDESGCPVNAKYAEHRAAQYIRQHHDPSYKVSPPFEAWEQELHGPPLRNDPKPWPPGAAV
ncbi:DUF7677 family protein [Xanthomonas campestris]|uniref:DUF7677 family protein n=1 Tax=Xanthomonas campestris TaxID=339 RepID=UPI00094ADBCB